MNYSFLLFIIGIVFFTIGYVNEINPQCEEKEKIKYVPRDVYDSLVMTNILK